ILPVRSRRKRWPHRPASFSCWRPSAPPPTKLHTIVSTGKTPHIAPMPLPARNTFAGNPLDRAGDRRNDPAWLAEQEANPEAVAMVIWQGRPLVEDDADGPRLAWLGLEQARAVVPDRELFLGLWKAAPVFAVEVESSLDPTAGPLAGLGAFPEMREAAALLPGPDAAMAGTAKSLF